MDLNIKYRNGSMVVHLEEFLSSRSITKVRKLIRLIQESDTPDEINKVQNYIEQELEQVDLRAKENEKYIVGYTEKVKFCQTQSDNCIHNRSGFQKNSSGWKHYNEYVKQYRQELREIKAQLSSRKSDFNNCIRNKPFYQKCIEIIS